MIETKERTRKEGIQRGVVNQKLMTFRIDLDVLEALEKATTNKGRYINDALREKLL